MAKEHVARNAGQILKYLEVLLPKLEPGGGIPDNPMNRKERGNSRAPVSDHVMRLWMSNPHLGRINTVLKEAAKTSETVEAIGRPMWEILGEVLWNHAAIRNWRGEYSKGNPKEFNRLWMMCLHLAWLLSTDYDGPDDPYEIFVRIDPDDEQLNTKTQAAAKDAAKTKTHNAQLRYRNLAAEIDEIMAEENRLLKEAVEELNERRMKRKREPVSLATVKRARAYVRGELTEGESDGVSWSRMEGEAS